MELFQRHKAQAHHNSHIHLHHLHRLSDEERRSERLTLYTDCGRPLKQREQQLDRLNIDGISTTRIGE